MHISGLKQSNFLTKEDVGPGILVTIRGLSKENVGGDGEEEHKNCLHFAEAAKPLVLNWTNAQLIAQITGSEETDDWIGKQIVLFVDPNVSMKGKVVGGIRARAPRIKQPPAVKTQPVQAPPAQAEENDMPF